MIFLCARDEIRFLRLRSCAHEAMALKSIHDGGLVIDGRPFVLWEARRATDMTRVHLLTVVFIQSSPSCLRHVVQRLIVLLVYGTKPPPP